ncbi:family 43 glycosylhydrolase [Paenibacillus sp. 2TAB19]|uniref:family 43 glycosylhydrolase n=1 Tax=Paenibacillus sp. 2TAB19 TaxID=3233003 RepID=UPI003F9E3655
MRDKHRFINAGFPSKWGDQGDGTYCNPILPADYSDPDVVRVGEDYFMAVSTFQQSGGVDILHSKDLVNWQTVSHAIPDVGILGPRFRWDHINNYGAGVFAPSIHYVNGKFRVYVNCYKGEGFFSATAEEAVGPWEVRQLEDKNGKPMRAEPWTDPDVFWDDNGEAYMAAAYLGTHSLYLFRMSPDGTRLLDADVDNLPQSGTIFYQIEGTEGNKIFSVTATTICLMSTFKAEVLQDVGGMLKGPDISMVSSRMALLAVRVTLVFTRCVFSDISFLPKVVLLILPRGTGTSLDNMTMAVRQVEGFILCRSFGWKIGLLWVAPRKGFLMVRWYGGIKSRIKDILW